MPTTRSKHAALHIEPDSLRRALDEDSVTPTSATTASPITPIITPPSSGGLEMPEGENDGEGGTGSDSASGPKQKEKRKRSRVTPEQLVHLERYFAADRSPTAARRREISELLGMQERQTQIWFQNRRAKAKMLDGKIRDRSGTSPPHDLSSNLATGYEIDLHNLIHEDEPVTLIPCSDLSVGTWRRIATTVSKHDLIAGNGFKMEIPFDTIFETELTHTGPGTARATFILSEPPTFYLEQPACPRPDGKIKHSWRQCSDWTEGAQATHVLRHELLGSAPQLSHLIHSLNSSRTGGRVSVRSLPYQAGSLPTMEIPAPPMAGLIRPVVDYSSDAMPASDLSHSIFNDSSFDQITFSGVPRPMQMLNIPSTRDLHSDGSTGLVAYGDGVSARSHLQIDTTPYNVSFSHAISRPYSASAESSRFFPEDISIAQSLQGSGLRRHSWNDFTDHSMPSAPLLTTPFHPASEMDTSAGQNSELSAIKYEAEEIHSSRQLC